MSHEPFVHSEWTSYSIVANTSGFNALERLAQYASHISLFFVAIMTCIKVRFEGHINGLGTQGLDLDVFEFNLLHIMDKLCATADIRNHLKVKEMGEAEVVFVCGQHGKDNWKWWGANCRKLKWFQLKVASDKFEAEGMLFGAMNRHLVNITSSQQASPCLCSDEKDVANVGRQQQHHWTCFLHRHPNILDAAVDINFGCLRKHQCGSFTVLVLEMDKANFKGVENLPKYVHYHEFEVFKQKQEVLICVSMIIYTRDVATGVSLHLGSIIPPGL